MRFGPLFLSGAIALALSGPALAEEEARQNAVVDVQVGEKGDLMRVAIVCRQACGLVAKSGERFRLNGVSSSLKINLAGRVKNAKSLAFSPSEGGSDLVIASTKAVHRVAARPCRIGGDDASCIDIEYGGEHVRARPLRDAASSPPVRAAIPPPARAFRDPDIRTAALAPPERLSPPPAIPPHAAPITPSVATLPTRKPIIDPDRAAALFGPHIDIRQETQAILGRNLGVAECAGAEARLRADAWALDAMVDVGFCRAAQGRLDDADALFIRLLDYTPDNYAALVGRALIAAKSGDKSIARKYFQDALNVPPPIDESNRIVAAMNGL